MPDSIVQTKLYVPRRRGATVPRPRLSDRLSGGIDARLTLVSAPAGFGKTTLLAAWLASAPRPEGLTAWLSLDQSDNDPTTFWTYLIAAAQTVAPTMGTGSLALIDAAQTSLEPVLGALLNELNALPNDLVLVLDDYHVIDDRRVHDGMAFFVDRLPPHVHLVIASRADPPLPRRTWSCPRGCSKNCCRSWLTYRPRRRRTVQSRRHQRSGRPGWDTYRTGHCRHSD